MIVHRFHAEEHLVERFWEGSTYMVSLTLTIVFLCCVKTHEQVINRVAERLMVLHEAGLVHRDMKSANILWLPRMNAWTIIDFECVATCGELRDPAFTAQYAAPEAVKAAARCERMRVSTSLDSWSLGVVAFELLTGEPWTPQDRNKQQVPLSIPCTVRIQMARKRCCSALMCCQCCFVFKPERRKKPRNSSD